MPTHRWWGIILLRVKINISKVNKNKKYFLFPREYASCIFSQYQDSNPQPQPRTYPSLPLDYTITCDHQWDIFLLSSLSNILYNPFHSYSDLQWKSFNYKVVDLVATYNFHTYFFFHLRSFENFEYLKFKIQNLNHEFGCQNNLNRKKFQLQSCRSGWDLQHLYRPFFNLRQSDFFKNCVLKYYKKLQWWHALMLHVTYVITKVTPFDNVHHLWLVKARHLY